MHRWVAAAVVLSLTACAEAALTGARPVRSVAVALRAPTPEEAERAASALPRCGFDAAVAEAWPEMRVPQLGASLRLPPAFRMEAAAQEPAAPIHAFVSEADSAVLFVQLVRSAEGSHNFALGLDAAAPSLSEGECAMPVAGRLAPVTRFRFAPPGGDVYMGVVEVVLEHDRFLGAGVVARTSAERDRLLAALQHLHVREN
jgi:hypothetical protein